MPTPYSDLADSFHSYFVSKTEIDIGLENQYLKNALGEYGLEIRELTFTTTTTTDSSGNSVTVISQINETLSLGEINTLGMLMYKYYLIKQRDEVMKLSNIVGRDVSLTATGQTKQQFNLMFQNLESDIATMYNRLKDNTYGQGDG